jgi:hypothetical protein
MLPPEVRLSALGFMVPKLLEYRLAQAIAAIERMTLGNFRTANDCFPRSPASPKISQLEPSLGLDHRE